METSPTMHSREGRRFRGSRGAGGVRVVGSLLALVVVLLLVLAWERLRGTHPSPPAAVQRADPARVRLVLLDPKQSWFAPLPEPSPASPMAVVPPLAARTDQADPPQGVREIPSDVIDFLFVSQQVRKQPLPQDHPFCGRHFELVDLRSPEAFTAARVPYSCNVPYERLSQDIASGRLARLEKTCILVIYGERYPYDDVVRTLREAGFQDLYCLTGGFASWKEAGFQVDGSGTAATPGPAPTAKEGSTTPPLLQLAPSITAAELYALMQGQAPPLVVFVSPVEDLFRKGHIPGAEWVPFDQVKEHFASYGRDRRIVFYCGCCKGKSDGLSGASVRALQEMGFHDVRHLEGHLDAWVNAGFSLVSQ